MTPRDVAPVPIEVPVAKRLDQAVERYGRADFVARSIALLGGANAGEEFLLWLGGRHAQGVLEGAPPLYWPEVWGARALLHIWDDSAVPAIVAGLRNEAWRVREMCAKVAAAHAVVASEELVPLVTDDVARVRAAAARAIGAVGGPEDAATLESLLTDDDIEVRRSAGGALAQVRER